MVSFWPWKGDSSSPASFEKALSSLSTKIATTQAQLDKTRSTARRIRVLWVLYLTFAYLVYAIVLLLVVGWRNLSSLDWAGLGGSPIAIYLIRLVLTTIFNLRSERLSARLKDQQAERAKLIKKLKEATKYDSTQELLDKYGGPEIKSKKTTGTGDESASGAQEKKQDRIAQNRVHMAPPPTANIPRPNNQLPTHPPPAPQPDARESSDGSAGRERFIASAEDTAEFAPNAFEEQGNRSMRPFQAATTTHSEVHWYDRIMDLLLGEDETAPKNRIVLICSRCRLVNGQAPPGTKSLSDIGRWKCMGCGATNGELDEGKMILREVVDREVESRRLAQEVEADEDETSAVSELLHTDKEDDDRDGRTSLEALATGVSAQAKAKKRKGKK